MAMKNILRHLNFFVATPKRSVFAVGAPQLPDRRQSLRIDRKRKYLVLLRQQFLGQIAFLEIFFCDWIVRRAHPKMQSEIETGWRLARARDPDHDNVSLIKLVQPHSIIVAECVVDGIDTGFVILRVDETVTDSGLRRWLDAGCLDQVGHEAFEQLEIMAIGVLNHLADLIIDHGRKNNRQLAFRLGTMRAGSREFASLAGVLTERWIADNSGDDDAPLGRIQLQATYVGQAERRSAEEEAE